MEVASFPKFIVIEFDVLNNEKLTNTEKILYGFICVLAQNNKSGCFASTQYLCEITKLKPRQLKYCLAHLKELNYIKIKIVKNRRFIVPTINEFIEKRAQANKNIQLLDYNWLEEE